MHLLTATSRIPFTSRQRRILLALAATVGLRMLGLFLVLPVFTLYGLQFTSSRFLVGFAFGCYGLTMAILQIPFGRLSDRLGRRKVLILGMGLFSVGSFLCAIPHWFPQPLPIFVLILGRLVQGGGAIISVAFAAVADHIEPERRSTAMAVLGIPIGAAFVVGVLGGPFLAGIFGTSFLFVLTGCLGLVTDILLLGYLPEVPATSAPPMPAGEVLRIRPLLLLSAGGFLMNFFMSSFFFHFPLIVTGQHHLKMTQYYRLLLPMMFISGITMFAFSRGADRGRGRSLSALAFLTFFPSVIVLFHPEWAGFDPHRLTGVLIAGSLFYIGFTGLEPVLPSLVSKHSPESAYGTALGIYNSAQFLGSPAGSSVSGALSSFPTTHLMVAILLCASIAGFLLMALQPKG
jgi:MFS family permease